MTSAHSVALAMMTALDANDASGVRRWFAPNAYWWVDTGLDRASGRFSADPGEDRPWPLHGRMNAMDKCDLLAGVRDRFPSGVRQTVRRSFATDHIAVLEVEGDGLFAGVHPYRNRYCFVIHVVDGLIVSVREYLDTAHAAAVFEGRNLNRRSTDDSPWPPEAVPTSPGGALALAFLAAISTADADRLLALCTADATWWADGGRLRTPGPEAPVDLNPGLLVVGRVLISARAARITALTTTYPTGLTLLAHRIIETPHLVAVEAVSRGTHRTGARYENRYAFVLTFAGSGRITEVREYCDTRHAFDVYGLTDRQAP
ncbi:hypothetical protein GCM10009555_026000 [Acrocarpospora macrocephala]|uniref:SnoaL-like domain-containing protein n=1 Tax=Acrocarpospora macrocephala TaxID=150177 RepID=A0A5M3WN52_9ACTN|nr:nuclear transport factor 2 family protein [Acrocarpospora macrocephala]GES10715.1 hypothetical protein Amac_043120 [Acrocarpospora macrocephala]